MRVVSFGGLDLDGCSLKAVERPWESNHFGDYWILYENLIDQVLFIHVWHPRSKRVSLTNTALVQDFNTSQV
jgi:hypothetical protein